MPTVAYVGLGANLGDPRQTLIQAFAELALIPGVLQCTPSRLYGSIPVDAVGPQFVNAVARLTTRLAPLELLDALQAIESRHGRLEAGSTAWRQMSKRWAAACQSTTFQKAFT